MKHVWALSGTLVLTTTLVVSGVAAAATTQPDPAPLPASAAASASSAAAANGFYWQLTTSQDVVPGTHLRAGAGHRNEGTRSDRQFFAISRTGTNDVPEAALRAYRRAETTMSSVDPGCRISWTMLAAIGRVESDHGRFGGSQLGTDGVSRPAIRGPQLDGAGPFAAIPDSDAGTLDRDRVWDRAVGQMQFLPETWRSVARDGDGDGRTNPQDIDDSALSSAVYLCGAGGSLSETAGMSRAAFRYNHSDYYVALVLSFQAGYESGVFAPPSPPPAKTAVTADTPTERASSAPPSTPRTTRVRVTAEPEVDPPVASTRPRETPRAAPRPPPRPTPTSTKPPTRPAPVLVSVTGSWSACSSTFCLDSSVLDLGGGDRAKTAAADFDGDGRVETTGDEFTGLVGQRVTVSAERRNSALTVYVVGDHGLRNQDGTMARALGTAGTTP